MARQEIERITTQLTEEILTDYPELELVDVEYTKEGPDWILRCSSTKKTELGWMIVRR